MSSQNFSDSCKVVQLIKPLTHGAGAISAAEIDTKGFRWATIVVNVGAAADASAALVITESNTSGSGHAAITDGASVPAEFAAATVNAATNSVLIGELDLMHTARYIDATLTAGSATHLSACVILSNAKSTGDLITATPTFQILNR
jgi:hypothetical protein